LRNQHLWQAGSYHPKFSSHFYLQENLPNLSEKELSNGHPVKSDVGAKDPTIPDEQGLDPKVYPQLRKTGTVPVPLVYIHSALICA
jgi:hypothetical protein